MIFQAGGGCLGPVHALAPRNWPFSPIIPSLQIPPEYKNRILKKTAKKSIRERSEFENTYVRELRHI